MKVLKEYPNKNWGYAISEDGIVATGWYRDTEEWTEYLHETNSPHRPDGPTTFTVRQNTNIILEGSIRIWKVLRGRSAAGCEVMDRDGQRYYMSIGNVVETLRHLADGSLKATGDGWITGTWTLRKQGDTVSLTPFQDTAS